MAQVLQKEKTSPSLLDIRHIKTSPAVCLFPGALSGSKDGLVCWVWTQVENFAVWLPENKWASFTPTKYPENTMLFPKQTPMQMHLNQANLSDQFVYKYVHTWKSLPDVNQQSIKHASLRFPHLALGTPFPSLHKINIFLLSPSKCLFHIFACFKYSRIWKEAVKTLHGLFII